MSERCKCEGFSMSQEELFIEIKKYGSGPVEYFGKLIITEEQQKAIDRERLKNNET